MSNEQLIGAVLKRAPNADPETILELVAACNADLDKVFKLLGLDSGQPKKQMTFKVSKPASTRPKSNAFPALKRKKGDTIPMVNLFDPVQVRDANIYCSLHTKVLDPGLANQVLSDLMEESAEWGKTKFYLFDRQVSSPHTSAIYSTDAHLLATQDATYQGRKVDKIRVAPPSMTAARSVVEKLVRQQLDSTGYKLPFGDSWSSGVAVANMYHDASSGVGWHSDQLTHLGPEPAIAGLSLGCTREFRLAIRAEQRPTRIYSIHVPHNSLVIMHPGCQELFKHSISPCKNVTPHPISGSSRISLTYRMYPPEFRSENIPQCKCGTPMILRNTREKAYKYLWQCGHHYVDNKGCGEVRTAEFKLEPLRLSQLE